MDRRILLLAGLLALLMPLGTAQANPVTSSLGDEVSAFALPLFEPEETAVGVAGSDISQYAVRYEPRGTEAAKPKGSSEPVIVAAPPRYNATRYQPRRSGPPPKYHSSGPSSWRGSTRLHGGFMRPEATKQDAGLFGFRAGPNFGQHVSLGFGTDWSWKNQVVSQVVGTGESIGGQPVAIHREIARSTSHHVPTMGYLQLSAGNNLPVSPYVGGGGGYQWLFLYGEDYTSGERFDATFGNWGWQAWAGRPVAPRLPR